MPIEIIGQEGSREWEAATELRGVLEPAIRPTDKVTIVVSAKCWGQRTQDIDLLVIALMGQNFVIPKQHCPAEFREKTVYVSNFALTVEVKDHDVRGIRFTGNQVECRYDDKWSSASEQSFQQRVAVVSHLKNNNVASPFWHEVLWLRNVPHNAIPTACSNVLGAPLTLPRIYACLIAMSSENLRKGYGVGSGKLETIRAAQESIRHFTQRIEPSNLDRRRMERICERLVREGEGQQKYVKALGSQILLFRGRGGSGKTIHLLRLAKDLHDRDGLRILFLTYNHALVSDLRRLFALIGISDRLGERSISIRTSESYFFGVLRAWKLSADSEVYDPKLYASRKRELLELFGALSVGDAAKEREFRDTEDISRWDYVLVDEGQDWPEDERDILFALFGPQRIIVADGIDQFVRATCCDWRAGRYFGATSHQVVPLRRSLRMKSNLCRASAAFASECDVEWHMEPNDEVPGGRIVIIEGEYTNDLHAKFMDQHAEGGNRPIDALFCVGDGRTPSAALPRLLGEWGLKVWDGTGGARDTFPTDLLQHRIVRYESCRGLEGWTVVCLDFDAFFDTKQKHATPPDPDGLFEDRSANALAFATRWALIPMTRAIDTLVLQVRRGTALAPIFKRLAERHKDFITYHFNHVRPT